MSETAAYKEQRLAKQRAYDAKRYARPEVKASKSEYNHSYKQRPEVNRRCRMQRVERMYGTNEVDWQNMFDAQMGECAACGDKLVAGKETHIDHDHRYGNNWWAVRGLLCASCNVSAGRLNHDPARVHALADYLEVA